MNNNSMSQVLVPNGLSSLPVNQNVPTEGLTLFSRGGGWRDTLKILFNDFNSCMTLSNFPSNFKLLGENAPVDFLQIIE